MRQRSRQTPFYFGLGLPVADKHLGYNLFIDVVDMPEAYQHLQVRLRIEQIRLLKWGEQIGLAEELLDRPSKSLSLNRNLIIDILLEIQTNFRACVAVQETYSDLVHKGLEQNLLVGEHFEKSFPRQTDKFLQKTLKLVERSPQATKRLRWAIIDQKKFVGLVEKLIAYNDSIESLLDRQAVKDQQFMLHEAHMVMLQLNSKIDDLRVMCSALDIKPEAGFSSACVGSPRSETLSQEGEDENRSVIRLASFKSQMLALEGSSKPLDILPLDTTEIRVKSSDGTRTEALYRGRSVLVEWKKYTLDLSPLSKWNQTIQGRVMQLAMLLGASNKPHEFRSPHCLGYFVDPEEDQYRYGLVYEKPEGISPTARAVSLLDLLTIGVKPSLTARIKLAHAVAKSLLYLHAVDWLHKGLRSDSILFFAPPGDEPDYINPTLAGFDYARPDRPGEQTDPPPEDSEHDMYRHPSSLNRATSRSRKSYDVYSLGIVLIEIAHWRRIDDIVKIPEDTKAAKRTIRNIRTILLRDDSRTEIEALIGDEYSRVVRTCLTSTDEPEDDDLEAVSISGAHSLQIFMEQVVDRLGRTSL